MKSRRAVLLLLGVGVLVVAVLVIVRTVDTAALAETWRRLARDPVAVVGTMAVYGTAFLLRAGAWRRLLPGLPVGQALAALHVSLAGNHVLPFRLGEPLRVTSVVRRAGTDLRSAVASTVTLRAADTVSVVLLAIVVAGPVAATVAGRAVLGVAMLALALAVGGAVWLRRLARDGAMARRPDAAVLAATAFAWVLEAVVIWQAARWAGVPLTFGAAVGVTAVTVAAQVAAVAPGGVGTYEAAATAALAGLGVDPAVGLAVAVTAHALKTAYALATGAVALVVPEPGILGRLRLRRQQRPAPGGTPERRGDRPVVLVLPAYDEGPRVADIVSRAPTSVREHPVEVVVVDDGSEDETATRASAAGARVIRHGHNRGLGAAVRTGLTAAADMDAVAVAFCDADGEYAPEELERLTAPILDGDADYVVGSRFDGHIRRMLPHRRLGNRLLTAFLRVVARHPITDGQSGYRALSGSAAADAEIIHDFNYAQVLTLDLLAKGYRYAEVPITYRFRDAGQSFVRLRPYLRAVIPAVWRELNPTR